MTRGAVTATVVANTWGGLHLALPHAAGGVCGAPATLEETGINTWLCSSHPRETDIWDLTPAHRRLPAKDTQPWHVHRVECLSA